MSKFKVGDRVRIIRKRNWLKGKEATVYRVDTWNLHDTSVIRKTAKLGDAAYCLNVDGVGKLNMKGHLIAFNYEDLEPLVPPDERAWQKFREHLKPNPLVIFDADPITVSTEHEAEVIADRVPNSHIIVAVYRNGKRIVLSEYYGRSTTNQPEGK